jgi:uncharacterized protein
MDRVETDNPTTGESPADRVVDFHAERLRRAVEKGAIAESIAVLEGYASAGSLEAQFLLGQLLVATEMPDNRERARHWLSVAADRGHIPACKKLFWLICQDGDEGAFERAIVYHRRAAELGDDISSKLLIQLYGDSLHSKEPHLLKYLQRHADLGHEFAQLRLAQTYDEGDLDVEKDLNKAFYWYSRSAEQGNCRAQCALGIMYALGDGVAQDDELAVRWYSEAARRGSAMAQCNLGYSYEIGRRPLQRSMQEANRWFRRSAMRDCDVAQHNLGKSYAFGKALPQNYVLANRWYTRSAAQGIDVSYAKAAELYAAAAQAGYAQAQQNYGYLLENGLGVDRNSVGAFRWYLAAAEQEMASAQSCVAWMYEQGVGVEQNTNEALTFYRRSAAQGDERGIDGLARLDEV